MCSLVMSLFSHDYIKTYLLSISNVLRYLNVYSIHTVPGFQMVEHQYWQLSFPVAPRTGGIHPITSFCCHLPAYSLLWWCPFNAP